MAHGQRFDHIGITVADLDSMTAFFVRLGLEVEGTPDHVPGSPTAMANELGLRNVSFEVGDLQGALDAVAAEGHGLIGGIGEYENSVRIAYVRGPKDHRVPVRADRLTRIIPRESGQVASPASAGVAFRRGALRGGPRVKLVSYAMSKAQDVVRRTGESATEWRWAPKLRSKAMPRFMGFVKMEEGIGAPPQALFDAMDTYISEQAQQGHFLDGGGLFGTEDAVNFVVRKGDTTRVDGPYAEAKEVVGGWALLQYDSLEAAIAGQQEFAELHAKYWPECEMVATLRQISEAPPEAADA